MSEGRRERGERLFREIVGAPPAKGGGDFLDITIEHLFGEVWARDDLSVRDRRRGTRTGLIALGQSGPCAFPMQHALESGDLTPRELNGLVIHLAHYAGWGGGTAGHMAATAAIGKFETAHPEKRPEPDGTT